MKIVLGRNSATNRIMAVEIRVFSIRIKRSESINAERRGPSNFGKNKTIYNKCNIIANKHCCNILARIMCEKFHYF